MIGVSGGDKGDIEAAYFIDFIVIDFGEDDLVFQAEVKIAVAVEAGGGKSSEVADSRQVDGNQAV